MRIALDDPHVSTPPRRIGGDLGPADASRIAPFRCAPANLGHCIVAEPALLDVINVRPRAPVLPYRAFAAGSRVTLSGRGLPAGPCQPAAAAFRRRWERHSCEAAKGRTRGVSGGGSFGTVAVQYVGSLLARRRRHGRAAEGRS